MRIKQKQSAFEIAGATIEQASKDRQTKKKVEHQACSSDTYIGASVSRAAKALTYCAGATAALSGVATPVAASNCGPGYNRQDHSPNHFYWTYSTHFYQHGTRSCMEKINHPLNLQIIYGQLLANSEGAIRHNLPGLGCYADVDNIRGVKCRPANEFMWFNEHEISDYCSDISICCPSE